jgi:uncharacterized protein YecE (DUF72 family)
VLRLDNKLGPILWQFPPTFKFDADRLEQFFRSYPRPGARPSGTRRHDERLDNRNWLSTARDARIHDAVEIRHESFVSEAFVDLLRRHRSALVVADTVQWPLLMDVTADFVYCRLHRDKELYASVYGNKALVVWAQRMATWANGDEVRDGRKASPRDAPSRTKRDVYLYFDNDQKVRAPFQLQRFAAH